MKMTPWGLVPDDLNFQQARDYALQPQKQSDGSILTKYCADGNHVDCPTVIFCDCPCHEEMD